MNMQSSAVAKKNGEVLPEVEMKAQIAFGRQALNELRLIVRNRTNPVIINGKRYLEFADWQILGTFFGISAYITETREITEEVPLETMPVTVRKIIGFWARAEAWKNGKPISAAEAECMYDEPNWKNKPRFQLRSMSETRACAKVLRQVLQWVVKLTGDNGSKPPVPDEDFADESAEEAQQQLELS